DRSRQTRRLRQVALKDLDAWSGRNGSATLRLLVSALVRGEIVLAQQRHVGAAARQGADGQAAADARLGEMAADEAGRAGDEQGRPGVRYGRRRGGTVPADACCLATSGRPRQGAVPG